MTTHLKERIRIYYNVRKNLELAKRIFEKHQSDGSTSILSALEGFNWDATGPKISFCLDKHKEAVRLSKSAEELYRQRDAVLAEITDIIRASKIMLQIIYPTDPEKLSEWGFITHDHLLTIEKVPP